MPTKKEYSRTLNDVLGTDITWERLTKDDLVEFTTLISEPDVLTKRLGYEHPETVLGDRLIKAGRKLAEEWKGPLASFAREFLSKEKEEEKGKQF